MKLNVNALYIDSSSPCAALVELNDRIIEENIK